MAVQRYSFMQFFYKFCLLLAVSILAGCAPSVDSSAADDTLNAWVTLLPQKTIVESIAGDRVSVEVMVRPGQSPETYSPSVPQMAALAKADLYFGIGMPLEGMILAKIERSMPDVVFVQTAEISDAHHHHVHHEGCLHGDQDPHVWMNLEWMIGFVIHVRDALIAADAESAEYFTKNAAQLIEQLRSLDQEIAAQLKPYAGRSFYINHPSLGHFAERYGLIQRSIEQAGSAPSARQIAELIEASQGESVGVIFSQPEFGRSSAEVLARALDVEVIELDVLSGDYQRNMLDIAQHLEDSFKQ